MLFNLFSSTKTDDPSEDPLDFNAILCHLSPFAKWQKRQLLFLWLSTLSAGVAVVVFAFTGFVPNYRCRISECENISTATYKDPFGHHFDFIEVAIGSLSDEKKSIYDLGQKCQYRNFDNSSECIRNGTLVSTTSSVETCSYDDVVFDREIVHDSLVEYFGFTCDRFYLRSVYNSLYMVGMLLGSFTIGLLSDHFGRRFALMVSVALLSGAGSLSAFVGKNLFAFGVLRVLTGMGGMGCYMVPYVIAAESSLPSYTVAMTTLAGSGFCFGELLLGLEAYFFRDWFSLTLVAYAPFVALLVIRFSIPESTRWLIAKRRNEEAREQILAGAKVNGTTVPDELLYPVVTKKEIIETQNVPKPNVLDLFRPWTITCRTIIMCLQWFSVTMAYFGLAFASTSLSGDPYLNFCLTVIAEIPSIPFTYFVVNRWGRRPILGNMQLLSGISCILAGLLMDVFPIVEPSVAKNLQNFQVFLSMAGKFGATVTFGMVYLYTTELYPTTIRNTAIGTCSCVARIGGILALLMGSLSRIWKPFPMVIMGLFATIAGLLAFTFPETTGERLPETMEDALHIGKNSDRNMCGCTRITSDKENGDTESIRL